MATKFVGRGILSILEGLERAIGRGLNYDGSERLNGGATYLNRRGKVGYQLNVDKLKQGETERTI